MGPWHWASFLKGKYTYVSKLTIIGAGRILEFELQARTTYDQEGFNRIFTQKKNPAPAMDGIRPYDVTGIRHIKVWPRLEIGCSWKRE